MSIYYFLKVQGSFISWSHGLKLKTLIKSVLEENIFSPTGCKFLKKQQFKIFANRPFTQNRL